MDVELLTVGTELVLGFTVDTNTAELGRRLAAAGIRVRRRVSVADEADQIRSAVGEGLERTGTVIMSGGLGPTRDDVTKGAVAELLGRRLVRDASVLDHLENLFRRRGVGRMPEANLRQADVPEGATVLPNSIGTAPGLWLEDGPRLVVMLPGVPKELVRMAEREVVPRLVERARGHGGTGAPSVGAATVIRSRTLRTTGISESALADRLGEVEKLLGPHVTLAFLPSLAGTDLRLTAWHLPLDEADAALARAAEVLRPRAGACVYGEGDDDLARVVLAELEARSARLSVAESCTGGLLGARLTAVPGSSKVFVGGVIAYENDVKLEQLGVSAETLAAEGAVSEAVVRQMAEGVARALRSEAALAITGIAGPDGGTSEKPVGTVWMAVRWRESLRAFHYVFPGDRDDVRARSAQWALDGLRRAVTETP